MIKLKDKDLYRVETLVIKAGNNILMALEEMRIIKEGIRK